MARLFSKQAVVNLAKQILKLGSVIAILWMTIGAHASIFAQVGRTTPAAMMFMTSDLVYELAWKFGTFLLVVALTDYIYERWQTISDVSGRGVGMDVVKKNITRLKGVFDVDTIAGGGTKFTIKLPLMLAIIQALLVRVVDELYAIPLDSVIESRRVGCRTCGPSTGTR